VFKVLSPTHRASQKKAVTPPLPSTFVKQCSVLTNYPNTLTNGGDCMLYLGWAVQLSGKGIVRFCCRSLGRRRDNVDIFDGMCHSKLLLGMMSMDTVCPNSC